MYDGAGVNGRTFFLENDIKIKIQYFSTVFQKQQTKNYYFFAVFGKQHIFFLLFLEKLDFFMSFSRKTADSFSAVHTCTIIVMFSI